MARAVLYAKPMSHFKGNSVLRENLLIDGGVIVTGFDAYSGRVFERPGKVRLGAIPLTLSPQEFTGKRQRHEIGR